MCSLTHNGHGQAEINMQTSLISSLGLLWPPPARHEWDRGCLELQERRHTRLPWSTEVRVLDGFILVLKKRGFEQSLEVPRGCPRAGPARWVVVCSAVRDAGFVAFPALTTVWSNYLICLGNKIRSVHIVLLRNQKLLSSTPATTLQAVCVYLILDYSLAKVSRSFWNFT